MLRPLVRRRLHHTQVIIPRVFGVLIIAQNRNDLSISWIKAHTRSTTPDAIGNADELAVRCATGSSSLPSLSNHSAPSRTSAWREPESFRGGARRKSRARGARGARDPRHLSYFDSALPLVQRPFSSRLVRACKFHAPHLHHLLPLRQSLLELNNYRIAIWSKLASQEVVASLDYTNEFLAFT